MVVNTGLLFKSIFHIFNSFCDLKKVYFNVHHMMIKRNVDFCTNVLPTIFFADSYYIDDDENE